MTFPIDMCSCKSWSSQHLVASLTKWYHDNWKNRSVICKEIDRFLGVFTGTKINPITATYRNINCNLCYVGGFGPGIKITM